VRFLIDHAASRLIEPTPGPLLFGTFRPLSGASKFDFAPASPAFRKYRGDAIVALFGDRAPYATSGRPLAGPVGYKVVRVNVDSRKVEDFVHNNKDVPASRIDAGHHGGWFGGGESEKVADALERPIDVKFGPDGAMYILDFGRVQIKNGKPEVKEGTGRIFRLTAPETPGTQPSTP
jgi:hypothetical protein